MRTALLSGTLLSFGFGVSSPVLADPVQRAGSLGVAYFDALLPARVGWSTNALADINRDGHDDVIGSRTDGTQIGIVLSTSDGYAPAVTLDLCNCFGGEYPPVAVGDLDGDGFLEVLVADEVGRRIWAVPFTDGAFGEGAWISTADVMPARFASAVMPDLDGDGRDDMIFISSGSLRVVVSTSPGISFTRQTGTSTYLGLTDLTGDGVPDMAAAGTGRVRVFPGGPQGFGEAVEIIVSPGRVSLVDLDGDGVADLTGSDEAAGEGWIRRNEGGGVFGPERRFPAIGLFTSLVNVGDLDGSGFPDVVGHIKPPGFFLGDTHVWHDPWVGGGLEPVALVGLAGPIRYGSRDLDGDGLLDLMGMRMRDITGLLNRGGPASSVGTRAIPIDFDPLDIRAADFDLNGVVDLVVCHSAGILILYGVNDGGYVEQQLDSGATTRFMSLPADINDDGAIDLVVSAFSNGIEIWPGSVDGLGQPPIRFQFDAPSSVWQIAIGDVTGDGVDDIVAADLNANAVRVLTGIEGGMPTAFESIQLESAKSIAVSDVDHDGVKEIVVTGGPEDTLWVFDRTAKGWSALAQIELQSRAYWLTSGDLDLDGLDDVAVGYDQSNNVGLQVLFGGPQGLSSPVSVEVQPRRHSEIVIKDVNGDSLPDLVVSPFTLSPVQPDMAWVVLQSAPRTFVAGGSLPGQAAGGVGVADLDGDSTLEIFGISNNGSTDLIQIHSNRRLSCPADVTGDGLLNFFDIHSFVGFFIAQDPRADLSEPFGLYNFFDVQAYMSAFGQGCP